MFRTKHNPCISKTSFFSAIPGFLLNHVAFSARSIRASVGLQTRTQRQYDSSRATMRAPLLVFVQFGGLECIRPVDIMTPLAVEFAENVIGPRSENFFAFATWTEHFKKLTPVENFWRLVEVPLELDRYLPRRVDYLREQFKHLFLVVVARVEHAADPV